MTTLLLVIQKEREIPTYATIMIDISGDFPYVFKNFLMRVAFFLSD